MSDSILEKGIQQLDKPTQDERIFVVDYNKSDHKPWRSPASKYRLNKLDQIDTKWRPLILRILKSRLNIIKSHREEIFQLATKYGASNIKVFVNDQGNNENGDNEVDFLVDLAEDRSLLDLGGLLMDLRELLGFDVFVFTEKTIKDIYLDRILQEALPL